MTYKQAVVEANNLLEHMKIAQPPVDVRKIAEKLGIAVSEATHQDDGMSGLILKANGRSLIGLNASHGENRKRFTLAHELGHHKLHTKDMFVDPEKNFFVKYRQKSRTFNPEESEANAFAAELLMPEKWITDDFKNLCENFKNLGIDNVIDILAKQYEVSTGAMKIRLDNLSLV